jgi:hypothetical protein
MGGVFVDDLVVHEIIDRKWVDNLPKFWGKKIKIKFLINLYICIYIYIIIIPKPFMYWGIITHSPYVASRVQAFIFICEILQKFLAPKWA